MDINIFDKIYSSVITGNKNIKEMKNKCDFIQITQAGFKESHIHDIAVTREAPNYKTER